MPVGFIFKYLLIVAALGWTASVHAFSLQPQLSFSLKRSWRRQTIPKNSRFVVLSSSSSSEGGGGKEEEIAKLEEQLRRLREEAEAEETSQQQQQLENNNEVATTTSTNSADYVGRGPAKRPVTPMEEMVTEAWKSEAVAQEEQEAGGGGIVPKVLGAIVFVVLLAVFAQAPVGQEDLSKYQGVKTAPTTQIDLGDLNPSRSSD